MFSKKTVKQFETAVLESDVCDWSYLSEGNAHIVFANECSKNNKSILKPYVLRIDKNECVPQQILLCYYCLANEWIGSDYVSDIIYPIHLPKPFVLELISKIQSQRSPKRIETHPFTITDSIESSHSSQSSSFYTAALLPNACILDESDETKTDVWTIDLKPKWMFLSESPFINAKNIKKHVCRFGLHQKFKFHVRKSVKSLSKYCPMSLLSGDIDVITANLKHLMNANQSNFKVFHRNKCIQANSKKQMTDEFVKTIAQIIYENCDLFKKISVLQRLDSLDIECVYYVWIELKKRNKLNLIQNEWKLMDNRDLIRKLNANYNKIKFGNEKCNCNESKCVIYKLLSDHRSCLNNNKAIEQFCKNGSDAELVDCVNQYLIASTFKDCQVMIAVNSKNKKYKITLIDLNAKPKMRIQNKWFKQDANIVNYYTK